MLMQQPLLDRYEDNGDAVNNLVVIAQKTDKNSITGYGGPDKFLNEFSYLLGKQVFAGDCLPPAFIVSNFQAAASNLSWACALSTVTSTLLLVGAYVCSDSYVQRCEIETVRSTCAGETASEGGFKGNKVSKAALLGVEEASDKKGKPYYKYELLTTTGASAIRWTVSQLTLAVFSARAARSWKAQGSMCVDMTASCGYESVNSIPLRLRAGPARG